jgi:hypothetical protein
MNIDKNMLTPCSYEKSSSTHTVSNQWFEPIPSDGIESPIPCRSAGIYMSSSTCNTIKASGSDQIERCSYVPTKSFSSNISLPIPYLPSSDAFDDDDDDTQTMNKKKFILPFRRQRSCAIPNYQESNLSWLLHQDSQREYCHNTTYNDIENEIIEQTKRWNVNDSSLLFQSYDEDNDQDDDDEIAFYWASAEPLVCP